MLLRSAACPARDDGRDRLFPALPVSAPGTRFAVVSCSEDSKADCKASTFSRSVSTARGCKGSVFDSRAGDRCCCCEFGRLWLGLVLLMLIVGGEGDRDRGGDRRPGAACCFDSSSFSSSTSLFSRNFCSRSTWRFKYAIRCFASNNCRWISASSSSSKLDMVGGVAPENSLVRQMNTKWGGGTSGVQQNPLRQEHDPSPPHTRKRSPPPMRLPQQHATGAMHLLFGSLIHIFVTDLSPGTTASIGSVRTYRAPRGPPSHHMTRQITFTHHAPVATRDACATRPYSLHRPSLKFPHLGGPTSLQRIFSLRLPSVLRMFV